MQTLFATLPIFLIIAAGYVLTRLRIAQNRWVNPLNNFVYYIALPALITLSLLGLDLTSPALQQTIVFTACTTSLISFVFAGIARILPYNRKTQLTIYLTAILGNTIFLGIPLATALAPKQSLEITTTLSVVFFTTTLVCSLFTIEIWLKKTSRGGDLLRNLGTNPIILSLIFGIFLACIPIPEAATNFMEMPLQLLAQTASPLALFALGGFLAHHHIKKSQWTAITLASILKLGAVPLVFLVAMHMAAVPADFTSLIITMASTPTAVTAFVLTEKYKLDSELAAGIMLASTILSVLSIPLLFRGI